MTMPTNHQLLPTTVTGSWPRPHWYSARMTGDPLSNRMTDAAYREQFLDATSVVVSDQERAGLDIVTNGDYQLDPDMAGRSWIHYPAERWDGLTEDRTSAAEAGVYGFEPGSLVNEIFTGWRFPKVVGKIQPRDPLELGKIWRIAQARTSRPVKIGTISAQTLAEMLTIDTDVYREDRRDLIWDLAGLINAELRELAAAGCRIVQVEEPAIHPVAAANPHDTDTLDFLVQAFNREVEGLDDVEVWAHTCWGNPGMQRVYGATSYEQSADIFLTRLNIDAWTVETKSAGHDLLPVLGQYRTGSQPKVVFGVSSHRTLQVESPEEVASDIRDIVKYVPMERVALSTDCGFGREGCSRAVAFYKAAAIAQGANIVRREYGLQETPVPAGDPRLQIDIPSQQRAG